MAQEASGEVSEPERIEDKILWPWFDWVEEHFGENKFLMIVPPTVLIIGLSIAAIGLPIWLLT